MNQTTAYPRLVIHGPPRTKKNSRRVAYVRGTECKKCGRGKAFLLQSKQHDEWAKPAIQKLKLLWGYRNPIERPVNVAALVYRERATGDLLNYLAAVSDALEHAGVVANDVLCVSWDGSLLLKDAKRPRVEIFISPVT